ncbi:MAG: hypothetical protein KGL39_09215 [Patescibacteria group bacterium]|nr:hypothetical protein [Patescibacteria group bacterium]
MMRVAYYTVEASTLSWARRLHDEGAAVLVYCPRPASQHVGEGIVPTTRSRETWVTWGLRDAQTIWFFDCTGAGKFADQLRARGLRVVGGGSFMDKLETDRGFGMNIAQRHGILLPKYREFSTVGESLAYMRAHRGNGGFAWKADRFQGSSETCVGDDEKVLSFVENAIAGQHGDRMKCLVQDRIDGEALSTGRWWNGHAWVGPYEGTVEFKGLMNGNVGPATGCALNTVWFYTDDTPKVARLLQWETLAQTFRAKSAPPGLYDINAIVNESGAWFLEWTPRLGVDSELTSQRGITSLTLLLERLSNGGDVADLFRVDTAYHGLRLSIPPYPNEEAWIVPKSPAIGQAIVGADGLWEKLFVMAGVQYADKRLSVADPFGFVGALVTEGRSVERSFAALEVYAKTLNVAKLQYRTDGAKVIPPALAKIAAMGYETSPFLAKKKEHAA